MIHFSVNEIFLVNNVEKDDLWAVIWYETWNVLPTVDNLNVEGSACVLCGVGWGTVVVGSVDVSAVDLPSVKRKHVLTTPKSRNVYHT